MVRGYHEDVPSFLRNRPPFLLQHCIKRMPPSIEKMPTKHITQVSEDSNRYRVRSAFSKQTYLVQLQSEADVNIPSCQCVDWKRHALPCKHLLAVLLHTDEQNPWNSLPHFYQTIPQFSLDPEIFDSVHHHPRL